MKLHANVVRFAPNDGYVVDAKKHTKAIEESMEHNFFLVSPGYYLDVHGDHGYAISEYMGKIGCGCEDMTFRCKGKEICKHLVLFMKLKDLPDKEAPEIWMETLKAAGWSGKKLSPPDRPENRAKRQRLPNIHDPSRTPGKKAQERAEKRAMYEGMSAEQIVQQMPDDELERNMRKGGVLAKAEWQRRMAEREATIYQNGRQSL